MSSGRIATLDGLRGLAIALVLLYHCEARLAPLGLAPVVRWGWAGVNLFFVLSGFLITGIILDGRGRPFIRNFYARRALRIWPVYFLVVPLNLWILGRANTWSGPGPIWPHFVFFVQNLTPGLVGTLYPTWSVAIEEQFYLIWAPLARWLPRQILGVIVGLLLGGGWLCRAYLPPLTPVNTLLHLDALAAGCALALGVRTLAINHQAWRWLAASAALSGVALFWLSGPWLNTGLALLFAALLISALRAAQRPAGTVARLLSLRPLTWLGTISYGLYLVHVPVFALLGGVDTALDRHHAGVAGDLAIVALRLSAAIALAALSWYGFEQPILRLKRYFAAAPTTRPTPEPVAVRQVH